VNYVHVPKHSQDHAESEYVSCGVDHYGAAFIGNKHTDTLSPF